MRRLVALFVALLLLGSSLSSVAAQDDAPTDPQLGDEVTFVDVDGNEAAVVVVEDLIDPFEDSADDPPRRSHFVLLVLSIENTGEEILEIDPAALLLQDDDGFLYLAEEDLDLGDEVPLEAAELDAGDDVAGVVAYAVPDSAAALAGVYYAPDDDRLVLLADLRAGGDGPAPTEEATEEATEEPIEETPTPAFSEDCIEITIWLLDTADRIGRATEIFDEISNGDPNDPSFIDTLTGFADELHSLSEAQGDSNPPADAQDANVQVLIAFNTYAKGLELLISGIQNGDQSAIADGLETVGQGDEAMTAGLDSIREVAADCGIDLS